MSAGTGWTILAGCPPSEVPVTVHTRCESMRERAVGLQADRAAMRRLQSADVTVPEIVAIFSDTAYDPDVRAHAIRHPACTLAGLRHVLDIGSHAIVDRIAFESHDPEILAYLARNGPSSRRAMIAYNAGTPPGLLADLARDPDPHVRMNAHVNPSTPPAAVTLLRADSDQGVREAREDCWANVAEGDRDLRSRVWGLVWAAQSWARRWAL